MIYVIKSHGLNWQATDKFFVDYGTTPILALTNLIETGGMKQTWGEHCKKCKPSGSDYFCGQCTQHKDWKEALNEKNTVEDVEI